MCDKSMNNVRLIVGEDLPNIPWEDRPLNCNDPVWRYRQNPIVRRDALSNSNSIFNSAVVPYEGNFIGVFRVDDKCLEKTLHIGNSKDGIEWQINEEPILFFNNKNIAQGYDPRVLKIEDKYYITWCNNYHGPTIGVAYTYDFKTFYQMENAFLPYNRNGVLFPKKINNKYAMLSRPSDKGHTPFGDIFYSESPDMEHWGYHRYVMEAKGGWSWTKVGAGPIPIETTEGWLLIYHGVQTTCNGMIYSMGAALLDLNEPWKVLYRAKPYIMSPQKDYECIGDVPNVVFPCAALCDAATNRIAIYYGAADTVVALAFTTADILIDFVKKNPI